jgi:YggT family protein
VDLLCRLINLYVLCMFGRIVLSWFPLQRGGVMATIHDFLVTITEPLLGPVRRMLPPVGVGGVGFDFSPIIVILGLQVVVAQLILGC